MALWVSGIPKIAISLELLWLAAPLLTIIIPLPATIIPTLVVIIPPLATIIATLVDIIPPLATIIPTLAITIPKRSQKIEGKKSTRERLEEAMYELRTSRDLPPHGGF